jgi:hypothetical protein
VEPEKTLLPVPAMRASARNPKRPRANQPRTGTLATLNAEDETQLEQRDRREGDSESRPVFVAAATSGLDSGIAYSRGLVGKSLAELQY